MEVNTKRRNVLIAIICFGRAGRGGKGRSCGRDAAAAFHEKPRNTVCPVESQSRQVADSLPPGACVPGHGLHIAHE